MKKYLVIAMFAMAAIGFAGCSQDNNTKADLNWHNGAGSDVKEIKWLNSGKVDQTWADPTADGSDSSFKGITELAGSGECLDLGGIPYTIDLTATGSSGYTALTSGSATIQENANATLAFDGITAK